ncbi:aminotransferase class I/II-fold pyridoxal phosphate-dependent enzyme [Streptomyces sp. NPDC054833]
MRRIALRGHQHDLDAMARAVRRGTKIIFVCSPNNPTGVDAQPCAASGLDEVYRDFATDPATADGLRIYRDPPNLVVLRSFSKSYGLAGLRIGYAVGQPGPIAGLRAVTMPFLVPAVATAAAVAAMDAEREFAARRERIVQERARVTTSLREAGIAVPSSEGSFVWLPLGAATAPFTRACEAEGLRVHAFDDEGVRVTIGTCDTNDLLLRVVASRT